MDIEVVGGDAFPIYRSLGRASHCGVVSQPLDWPQGLGSRIGDVVHLQECRARRKDE